MNIGTDLTISFLFITTIISSSIAIYNVVVSRDKRKSEDATWKSGVKFTVEQLEKSLSSLQNTMKSLETVVQEMRLTHSLVSEIVNRHDLTVNELVQSVNHNTRRIDGLNRSSSSDE